MSALQSCMGGWCARRDHCANYHAASVADQPAERLCPPGNDGAGLQEIKDMTRTYIHADERRRQALALLRDGITIAELREGMGYASNENATRVMETLVYAGQAFSSRAKCVDDQSPHPWTTFYFTTAEARDAFVKAKNEAIKTRIKARKKATAKRMPYYVKRKASREESARLKAEEQAAERSRREAMKLAEAEQRKERARLDREGKAAQKARAKAEAKKTQQRLKAETKAAGSLVFKAGTEVARPKKVAFADMPALNPNNVQPKVIPCQLRDRFATTEAPSVVSSRECRRWAEVAAA